MPCKRARMLHSEPLTPAQGGEARKFLREVLANGSVPAEELLRQARKLGLAEKTVRRAKADLGIRAHRVGQGREQRWLWTLAVRPPEMATGRIAEIVTEALAISKEAVRSPEGAELLPDQPSEATQVVAVEGLDGETPDRTSGTGLVPAGLAIPQGVECVLWNLESAPLRLGRGVIVFDAEDFVKRHLEALAAKLRGDNGWLYSQWPLCWPT